MQFYSQVSGSLKRPTDQTGHESGSGSASMAFSHHFSCLPSRHYLHDPPQPLYWATKSPIWATTSPIMSYNVPLLSHHIQYWAITSNSEPSYPILSHHIQYWAITSNTEPSHPILSHHIQFWAITSNSEPSQPIPSHHIQYWAIISNTEPSHPIPSHHIRRQSHHKITSTRCCWYTVYVPCFKTKKDSSSVFAVLKISRIVQKKNPSGFSCLYCIYFLSPLLLHDKRDNELRERPNVCFIVIYKIPVYL
jgi:hypothetical protein